MFKYTLFFSLIFAIGFSSCDKGERILKNDIEKIEEYLDDNNLSAERTANDLFYIIEEEGNGEFPDLSSKVTVDYHGYLLNGSVFDSSIDKGEPLEFFLTEVIRGWREGIPLFSKGGKGKLFIPSHLAYGEAAQTNIPANSVLIFDIHLIDF